MKRIDALKGKLKAAKAELTIRYRQFNAAQRGLMRVLHNINQLEKKIEKTNLALVEPRPRVQDRGRGVADAERRKGRHPAHCGA